MAAPLASPKDAPRRLGRYVLARELWTTAWFSVWTAADTSADGAPVAVKRVHAAFLCMDEGHLRLSEAARLGITLAHPNVLAAREVLEEAGELVIVTEPVSGVPLREVLLAASSHGVIVPVPVAVRIALELLAALETAHGASGDEAWPDPITPLDLTPENVLVSSDGAVKLLDLTLERAAFGLVSPMAADLVGYRAPERLDGPGDQRSDLFAVGVLLWEMLAGKQLFTGGNVAEALKKRTIPRLDEAGVRAAGTLPTKLAGAIARSLTRATAGRFPSADHMGQALMSSGATVASPEELAALVAKVQRARAVSGTSLQAPQVKREEFLRTPVVGTLLSPLARPDPGSPKPPEVKRAPPVAKPTKPNEPTKPAPVDPTPAGAHADGAEDVNVSFASERPPPPPPPPSPPHARKTIPTVPGLAPLAPVRPAPVASPTPRAPAPVAAAPPAIAPLPAPVVPAPAPIAAAPPLVLAPAIRFGSQAPHGATPAPPAPPPTPAWTPPSPPVELEAKVVTAAPPQVPPEPPPYAPPADDSPGPLLGALDDGASAPAVRAPWWRRAPVVVGAAVFALVLWVVVLSTGKRAPEPRAVAPTPPTTASAAPPPPRPRDDPPPRVAETPAAPVVGTPTPPGATGSPAVAAPDDGLGPGGVTPVRPTGSADVPAPAPSEVKPPPPQRRRYNPKTI